MYKSAYLNNLLQQIKEKYKHEKEYIDSIEEFFDSIDIYLQSDKSLEDKGILERLIEPERVISFRVPWVDDNNKICVNTGYRVQFNSAIGPYKGGLRFDKSVNLSILKFLGFEQTFKNSLTGLPLGGGKGGSDFDPHGKSDAEIMRFCQSFMNELYPFIGPNLDVPAGDLGCGNKEIGYLFGQYKKLTHDWSGAITGKCIAFGGSYCRPEATGYGLCYFVNEMLNCYKGCNLKGKKVLISGFGKVATMAFKKAIELGAIVVGMSDSTGMIYDASGLDGKLILSLIEKKERLYKNYLEKHPEVKHSTNPHDLWNNKTDLAFPCATQNEIDINDARNLKENGCYLVAEGANMPSSLEAIRFFIDNDILFAPGKAANAGGVAVSGLEMSQNAMHISWSFEEVDAKLSAIMKNIFRSCYEMANKFKQPNNLSLGVNIAGFMKVYQAMEQEGII